MSRTPLKVGQVRDVANKVEQKRGLHRPAVVAALPDSYVPGSRTWNHRAEIARPDGTLRRRKFADDFEPCSVLAESVEEWRRRD